MHRCFVQRVYSMLIGVSFVVEVSYVEIHFAICDYCFKIPKKKPYHVFSTLVGIDTLIEFSLAQCLKSSFLPIILTFFVELQQSTRNVP